LGGAFCPLGSGGSWWLPSRSGQDEFVDELSYKLWLHQRDPANAGLLSAIWVTELAELAVAALWYGLPLLALFFYAFRRSDIWHPSQSSGTPPAPG
jgi:hypothetical protein